MRGAAEIVPVPFSIIIVDMNGKLCKQIKLIAGLNTLNKGEFSKT